MSDKNIDSKQQKKIIIIGCGGHARSVCDTLSILPEQYEIENKNFVYEGIKTIGIDDDLQQIYDLGIHKAVLGIGFLGHGSLRNDLIAKLHNIGFSFPTIVDPTAIVSKSVKIGEGTFIGKNAVVNANARIGRYCIINSCSLVEHDCRIGDFTHIAVAACVCGGVTVGKECLVGANATIIQGLSVADHSIVPAGNVIRRHVKTDGIKESIDMREDIMGGVIRRSMRMHGKEENFLCV